MKKTTIKNSLIAVCAACAMTQTLTVSAVSTGMINSENANTVTPNSTANISINKDILMFNTEGSDIYAPNITYSYNITSASTNNETQILTYANSDLENGVPKPGAVPIAVIVHPGKIEAISTTGDDASTTSVVEGSIAFGGSEDTLHNSNTIGATAVDTSKKVTGSMRISVDANKIFNPDYDPNDDSTKVQLNPPGIYRYKISDVTTAATFTAAGVSDGGADNDIYLDVYTKYNNAKDGLEVYGYVLFKSDNDTDSITYDSTVTSANEGKVTGFDVDTETETISGVGGQETTEYHSDKYYTYNVKVKKLVDGGLADAFHNFPFKVELSNASVTSADDFSYTIKKDGTTGAAVAAHLAANGSWTLDGIANSNTGLQLRHGDEITLTGLPTGTKIKVTEKNDTGDIYIASAKGTDDEALNLKSGTADAAASVAVSPDATAEMNAVYDIYGTETITFTNTMKDISVTGLLFSVAPFIILTAAGAVLIVMVIRSRKHREDNDVI
ncbi:DUF7601 domain-containing protein [Ruminococcus albus]|uniref:DUF7601 domain-containing protein n=1 Tax=Ruminococcus albus TaxID=1264 RepID=A0A1H7LBD2_RUMAL|nr:hypothetical protein [Ruminococcus albus]SEK96239.1 hypothetical protein SAMN05216469_108145 [Ruminococcus albus]